MSIMIGVDVGGTFTDFSTFDTETGRLKHFKHSSTPEDPSKAIVSGILHVLEEDVIGPEQVSYLAHGTTVATNALIEKKGARLGLITTKGFKDLMEIGWQKRPSLYDLSKQKPESLIPDGMKCEVEERILYDGTVKTALNEDSVREAVRYLKDMKAETIAVCTLFSFLNPVHEDRIKEIIREEYPEVYVSVSHELVPEFREYSRMSTTVLNAYLGPVRVSAVGDIVKPDLKEEKIQENAPAPEPFDVRNVLFDREKDYISTNIYHREDFVPGCVIEGPAIIEQMDSTSVIPPGWKAYTDGYRNLRVTYEGGGK